MLAVQIPGLAFASDRGVQADTIRHFKNAEFGSFYDVMNAYLIDAQTPVSTCCVAMAGPVVLQKGKLTNLDWDISADRLCTESGSKQAFMMNDLDGTRLCGQRPDNRRDENGLRHAKVPVPRNGQSLVIGMGTGFNVCPVKVIPSGEIVCLEAEAGHAAITKAMADRLEEMLGSEAAQFSTYRRLFCRSGALPPVRGVHAVGPARCP